MGVKDDYIRIDKDKYWKLREQHERLAKETGHVRQMVVCAKERLNEVVDSVIRSDRPKGLCYDEDQKHLNIAQKLLADAAMINLRYMEKGDE